MVRRWEDHPWAPAGEPWSRAAWEVAADRDWDRRLRRPETPSTSSSPRRCRTCREWQRTDRTACGVCGAPFTPEPLLGPSRG